MYWKNIFRSYFRIHQRMLPCGYWSCHCPVLWYKLYWKYYHPRGVDLSIPNYVSNTLHEFQRPYSKEYAPHKWERPNYVVKAQWSKEESLLEILPKPRRKNTKNWGDFPYYFWAVNPILLVALESIGVEKSKGTTQLEAAVQKHLDYCATHPNLKLWYHTIGMILRIHSNTPYL